MAALRTVKRTLGLRWEGGGEVTRDMEEGGGLLSVRCQGRKKTCLNSRHYEKGFREE